MSCKGGVWKTSWNSCCRVCLKSAYVSACRKSARKSLTSMAAGTSDVQESAREGMSASGGVPWGAGGLLGKKM